MKTFIVVREIVNTTLVNAVETKHIAYDRIERNTMIRYCLKEGNLMTSFIIDENDSRGRLIHNIMDNGVVIIQNERTKRIVTQYVARRGQITKYWRERGMSVPPKYNRLLEVVRHNEEMGYNLI